MFPVMPKKRYRSFFILPQPDGRKNIRRLY